MTNPEKNIVLSFVIDESSSMRGFNGVRLQYAETANALTQDPRIVGKLESLFSSGTVIAFNAIGFRGGRGLGDPPRETVEWHIARSMEDVRAFAKKLEEQAKRRGVGNTDLADAMAFASDRIAYLHENHPEFDKRSQNIADVSTDAKRTTGGLEAFAREVSKFSQRFKLDPSNKFKPGGVVNGIGLELGADRRLEEVVWPTGGFAMYANKDTYKQTIREKLLLELASAEEEIKKKHAKVDEPSRIQFAKDTGDQFIGNGLPATPSTRTIAYT